RRLSRAGFQPLKEEDAWQLTPGMRGYVVRGGSSIAAVIVGQAPAHEAGFLLVGAHTDSPNLRVRPLPDVRAHGYRQLAVEPYGGLLQSTWMDRDLSIAGRVVVAEDARGGDGGRTHLIDWRRALLRIPNVAIHLNRSVNSDGLKLNPQTQMVPVMGLVGPGEDLDFPELVAAKLREQGIKANAEAIVGYDLCLYDVQPAALAGLHDELLLAGRLDNLASCHAAIEALCAARDPRPHTRGVVLYDHEEVGSKSAQGAGGPFLEDLLARLADAGASHGHGHDALSRAVARSLLISADMAHGVHPNYADKHEPAHRPVLGQGPVIKTNVAQSYATDAETSARFALLCRRVSVTPQHFVSRSDQTCGSTIGPITAGRIGLRTVDVGSPLLSMHSVREMAAVADVDAMVRVLSAFFA
ncbi:MAG TPA: M18 family aminopeptidase, partial [Polyangiales bacterium]|nr:M18 family aminopeptidase [Polyangiales bacterium]